MKQYGNGGNWSPFFNWKEKLCKLIAMFFVTYSISKLISGARRSAYCAMIYPDGFRTISFITLNILSFNA